MPHTVYPPLLLPFCVLQKIVHPGCVWSVGFLSNGDVVSGASDGTVRIFTQDSARMADPDAHAVRPAFSSDGVHSVIWGDREPEGLVVSHRLVECVRMTVGKARGGKHVCRALHSAAFDSDPDSGSGAWAVIETRR